MSVLLACGFLVSCFSVEVFAEGDDFQLVPLPGGWFSIAWNSFSYGPNGGPNTYRGYYISSGLFDDTTAHVMNLDQLDNVHNVTPLESAAVQSLTYFFNTPFRLEAGRKYLIQSGSNFINYGVGLKYENVRMTLLDQYNNVAWSSDSYEPGLPNTRLNLGANGFCYWVVEALVPIDVVSMRIDFDGKTCIEPSSSLTTLNVSQSSWLQCALIVDSERQNTDEIIKSIQDQTAEEQKRYDDFTSNGSSQGSSAIDSTQESVSGKIGLLDFSEGVLSDFIGLFSSDPGDATLTLPGFKWHDSDTNTDLTVWESQTFDFSFVEQHFGPLVSALRVGTVLTIYGALLWYLQAVFDRIFGGGDRN